MLRIFIEAPLHKRIERKALQENLSYTKAARLVKKKDKQRKKYYETYTGQIWGHPTGYDICLDTGEIDFEEAVNTICALYEKM